MQHRTSESRLNIVLRWICAALFVSIVAAALNALANLPDFYRQAVTLTLPAIPFEGYSFASNERIVTEAALRGMPIHSYVNYRIATDLVYALTFYTVAFLILRRAGGRWFVWFTAMILMFVPSGQISFYSDWNSPITRVLAMNSLLWPAFPLFLYLFPNGRAVPRWMLWLIGPVLLGHLALQAIGWVNLVRGVSFAQDEVYFQYVWVLLISFPLAMVSQVYRYLRVSNREERLQTKWVMGGLVLIIFINWVVLSFFGDVDIEGDQGYLSDVSNLNFLIIPITIGISILRYRLYDIDLIIRRTLQYAVVSLLLGLVYFGLVVALGQVFQGATEQQSPLSIVISTLVIAALANPLRRRVQAVIDRRFFRSSYDAAQAVAEFTSATRSQVELDVLARRLAETAQSALQPEGVWLWIRPQPQRLDTHRAPFADGARE